MENIKKFGINAEIKKHCRRLVSNRQGFVIYFFQKLNKISTSNENGYATFFPFPRLFD